MHFVYVAIHGFFVVEGTEMHVEFALYDELSRTFEFRLKILNKYLWRCDDLVIFDLRINNKLFNYL